MQATSGLSWVITSNWTNLSNISADDLSSCFLSVFGAFCNLRIKTLHPRLWYKKKNVLLASISLELLPTKVLTHLTPLPCKGTLGEEETKTYQLLLHPSRTLMP